MRDSSKFFYMDGKLREPGGFPPDYSVMDPDLFTMKVNHGGQLSHENGNVTYDGGQAEFFDFCRIGYISMGELEDFAKRLGYERKINLYHRLRIGGSIGNFEPLITDMDVFGMMLDIDLEKELEIFMVEPIKPLQMDFTHAVEKPIVVYSDEEDGNESVEVEEDVMDDEDIFQDAYNYACNEANLHDVEVDVELVNDKGKNIRGDDDDLLDSEYAQSEDDYMPEKAGKKEKVYGHAESSKTHEDVEFDSDVAWSVDDMSSGCDSDHEMGDGAARHKRFSHFNPQTDMANPTFKLGMVFPTAGDFRKAIREYSILSNRAIRFVKNERTRVRAVCKGSCPWTVFASSFGSEKSDKSLVVKTFNPTHSCHKDFQKKWVSSNWIAERFREQFFDDPRWNINSFTKEIRKKTGVQVSKWQYYRSRKKAIEQFQGSVEEQYKSLWDYCEALKEANPGTTVKMKLCNEQFQRLYICFDACKKGWIAGCRPLIGLDGCFTKGLHEGFLLVAIGIDGDNSIYPIAYAAVESERFSSWSWFLEILGEDLAIANSHGTTWITDKQKGLVDAVKTHFPNSEHRFCVRHMYNNFKTRHKGLHLKQLMWNAARATTRNGFDQEMEKLKAVDTEAYQWLLNKDPKNWSRAFFSTYPSCDILLNNLCEVFNAVILNARDEPIITCMESIRRYISKRMVTRKELGEKWEHQTGPRVSKILEKNKMESINSIPEYCGNLKFEVRSYYIEQYRVDLLARTCDCNRWQLTGLPCPHAFACILNRDLDPMDYVDECYKKERFLKAYEESMRPMPGPNMWKKTTIVPPKPPAMRRLPGRPKKVRRKEPDEVRVSNNRTQKLPRTGIVMTCRLCGGKDHNRSGCPNKRPQSESSTTRFATLNAGRRTTGENQQSRSSLGKKGKSPMKKKATRKEKGKNVASKS